MAFISINYDGFLYDYDDHGNKILTEHGIVYENVEIVFSCGKKFIFNSGDFVSDWYNAIKKYYKEYHHQEPFLSFSSSVNHFIMDGSPYDSAYIHFDKNDKPLLKYLKENWADSIEGMIEAKEIYEKGIEVFVPENTRPTYEEYIKLIK